MAKKKKKRGRKPLITPKVLKAAEKIIQEFGVDTQESNIQLKNKFPFSDGTLRNLKRQLKAAREPAVETNGTRVPDVSDSDTSSDAMRAKQIVFYENIRDNATYQKDSIAAAKQLDRLYKNYPGKADNTSEGDRCIQVRGELRQMFGMHITVELDED